jgi:hypothetical protein
VKSRAWLLEKMSAGRVERGSWLNVSRWPISFAGSDTPKLALAWWDVGAGLPRDNPLRMSFSRDKLAPTVCNQCLGACPEDSYFFALVGNRGRNYGGEE